MNATKLIVKDTPTFEGLFNKIKNQLIVTLNYSESTATEDAKRYAIMFTEAFSE